MSSTIKDVARLAGVSPSTVSRVLNQKGTISEDTKSRIYQAMDQLKYVPNDIARNFANGSPRTIALVIDVADAGAYANSFFNNSIFGIETAAHRNGYSLMITNGSEAFGGISGVERLILGKKVDGVIFPISLVNQDFLRKIDEIHFPCVILGKADECSVDMSWVDINNIQAGTIAARHMLRKGYKRIFFLSDSGEDAFNRDRIYGYSRELSANGIPAEEQRVIHIDADINQAVERIGELLASADAPDAVICSSDRLALGALRAAVKAGLKVPDEFGCLSFDRTAVTDLSDPTITCIDVDTFELGIQAAEMLIEQVEDPMSSMRQVLLSTKIIECQSTARGEHSQ